MNKPTKISIVIGALLLIANSLYQTVEILSLKRENLLIRLTIASVDVSDDVSEIKDDVSDVKEITSDIEDDVKRIQEKLDAY